MIIDLILDRKDGQQYSPREFYAEIMDYRQIWPELADPIGLAMDYGTNDDIRRELCLYVEKCGYNPEIKDYINTQNWI